jgi:hypothetical protein
LEEITQALEQNHTFPQASKGFVVTAANGTDTGCRHVAIGLLVLASSQYHLYPKQELLDLIEKKAIGARGFETSTYLLEYAAALGLGRPPRQQYQDKWKSLEEERKSPNTLDQEEKTFASEMLVLQEPQNTMLAGRLFVQKFDTDSSSFRWIHEHVTAQSKKTQGNVKLFWEYVQRVSSARHPVPHS